MWLVYVVRVVNDGSDRTVSTLNCCYWHVSPSYMSRECIEAVYTRSLTCIAHERVQQGLYTVFKIYNNKSLKRVWITQILVISAATGMSVHPIRLGNALKQSTPIVHAYRGKSMSQGGSNVVSLRDSSRE